MFLSLLILGVLLVAALAYLFLPKGPNGEPPEFINVLQVVFLSFTVLGFGTCGGLGSYAGIKAWITDGPDGISIYLVPSALGLLIAIVLLVVLYRMWRPRQPRAQKKEPTP